MKQEKSLAFISIILFLSAIFSSCHHDKEEKETGALDALRFFGTMNAYPNMDLPPGAFGRAYDFYKANYSTAFSKTTSANFWRSIGPDNVGGRTISFAMDPVDTNIIWLGSASGGLWKSVTGGTGPNAWQYMPTGFPVLGVAAIAINPQNKNEMYIGTGETYDYGTSVNGLVERTTRGSNGIGILKSTDGGVTWSHTLNWLYNQERGVWDIIINPLHPQTVFAATTEGIYKTIDAGISWSQVLSNKMVMDLEMDPADTSILYAGVGNLTSVNKGLYKTSNGGSIWSLLTNGLPPNTQTGRISITTYKSNSNIVIAHIADQFSTIGLYRSVNKGLSFTALANTTNITGVQGWYANGVKIKDNDSSQVLISGQFLWASTTSGNNPFQFTFYDPFDLAHTPWTDMHGVFSNPLDADKLYLLTDAGLYRSNDFGQSWYSCIDGYIVSQFYIGDVSATDSLIAIGGLQDRNTQLYNGSTSWNFFPNGDGTFTAIDKTDDNYQYTSSQYLNIAQSNDKGANFYNFFSGTGAGFVAPYVIAPSNHDVMYAGDVFINQIDIPSFGVSSNPSPTGEPLLSIAVSAMNDQKIYFSTAPAVSIHAGIFRSIDGGINNTDITQNLPDRYPRDIEVNPLDDAKAYVVFSGFGSGHIFKTGNSGNSWTDVSTSLPDLPFHTILCLPTDTSYLFAGSDLGVFYSSNGGTTWQALNNGLPEAVMIFDLKYSPADNNLVAFTHGHGVYKMDITSLPTGTGEQKSVSGLQVYPIPANDFITIDFFSASAGNIIFSVVDPEGKKIMEKNVSVKTGKNHFTLELTGMNSGVYFLVDNKRSVVWKFIKL